MRKYIKIVVITSIILGLGLTFLLGIYLPSVNVYENPYIATDDTYYSGHDAYQDYSHGNDTSLIAGRYETSTSSAVYYTFIKFDLTNKPKD